ncbi:hypothetical protein FHG87_020252 [Trinorchestia longiramus]|nr:hypothetical protein FHG87_020252 [Trinorchestia longiramus]
MWRWNEGNNRLCMQFNRGVEKTVRHLVWRESVECQVGVWVVDGPPNSRNYNLTSYDDVHGWRCWESYV